MPIERIIKAVRDYLDAETGLIEMAAPQVSREALKKDLEQMRAQLRRELAAYEDWRYYEAPFRHVLVAVDGSEQAGWAVGVAGRIAGRSSAKVTLLHVVPEEMMIGPEYAYSAPSLRTARRDEGEAYLRRATQRLPRGLCPETILYEGEPVRQIVSAAKDLKADLIILGTHGRSGFNRLLLGSTAEGVVRHAPCPVLTVAHPFEDVHPAPAEEVAVGAI